jgi:arylsulfatase A-like enzyme
MVPEEPMLNRREPESRRFRPHGLALLAACSLALAACGGVGEGAPGLSARHVVMISMDTTRADHMGFYGSQRAETPRLDALARESLVFTDFAVVAPMTLPSHTSLFTGTYPHRHGVPRNGFLVDPANEMLPEILSRAGFHTAGFAACFALASRFNFAQGFDHYDEEFGMHLGQGKVGQDQRAAVDVTDAVARYLAENGVPEHLFLFAHYFDPHQPYAAPAPWDVKYDLRGRLGLPPLPAGMHERPRTPDQKRVLAERFSRQYAAEISYMDHAIGRLLDDLRARGVLDQALTVVPTDHGEGLWLGEDSFGHGSTLYQNTMRSVLLVRLPRGARGGTRVDGLAASVDVLPTLLRTLGLPVPPGLDGEALDLWDPESLPSATVPRFGQACRPREEVETHPRWHNQRKARYVRRGRYKLIQTPYLRTQELYDLVSDPAERQNLLRHPTPEILKRAGRLRVELDRWAASARPLAARFDEEHFEDTVERLRRLGYVVSPGESIRYATPPGQVP